MVFMWPRKETNKRKSRKACFRFQIASSCKRTPESLKITKLYDFFKFVKQATSKLHTVHTIIYYLL
jgi:hypothetical protein